MAWRNLGRNRKRTVIALIAIATAQWTLVVYQGVLIGFGDWMLAAITGPLVGHVQLHAPDWREDRALDRVVPHAGRLVADLRADPEITRAAARVYAPALIAQGEDGQAAMLVGLDFSHEAVAQGLLGALPPERWPKPGEVLAGKGLAQQAGFTLGASVALMSQGADGAMVGEMARVAGIVSTTVDPINQSALILPLATLQEWMAMPDQAHEIVVYTRSPDAAAALAGRLATWPQVKGLEALDWRRIAPELSSYLDLIGVFQYLVVVLVFIAAAAGIANTLMMAVFERTRELGMVLALGATPRRVVGLVMAEAVLLGVSGVVIGTGFGMATVAAVHRGGIDLSRIGGGNTAEIAFEGMAISMKVFPRFSWTDSWSGIVVVALTAVAASAWPAWRAARLHPVEAMRG